MASDALDVKLMAVAIDAELSGIDLSETLTNETFAEAKDGAAESSVHPVVRTHPESGHRSLFINCADTMRFEDMAEEENRPALAYLCHHAERPEFSCRFRWQQGSLAVWDNRVTMHAPIDDEFRARNAGVGFRRVMHRATFAAEALI